MLKKKNSMKFNSQLDQVTKNLKKKNKLLVKTYEKFVLFICF